MRKRPTQAPCITFLVMLICEGLQVDYPSSHSICEVERSYGMACYLRRARYLRRACSLLTNAVNGAFIVVDKGLHSPRPPLWSKMPRHYCVPRITCPLLIGFISIRRLWTAILDSNLSLIDIPSTTKLSWHFVV